MHCLSFVLLSPLKKLKICLNVWNLFCSIEVLPSQAIFYFKKSVAFAEKFTNSWKCLRKTAFVKMTKFSRQQTAHNLFVTFHLGANCVCWLKSLKCLQRQMFKCPQRIVLSSTTYNFVVNKFKLLFFRPAKRFLPMVSLLVSSPYMKVPLQDFCITSALQSIQIITNTTRMFQEGSGLTPKYDIFCVCL